MTYVVDLSEVRCAGALPRRSWPGPCHMACARRCSMCASIAADDTNDSGLSSNGGHKDVAALLPVSPDVKARISILIVDDEHTLREGCASVLRKEGYDVTVSGRGSEAREL